ncbi:MAG TPA: SDR family oxidoreductase [Candidatus Limnocylindria bacterium]|nr:SDR family oxidoreductase [Candidatus Limnocylindria bacterium]
MSLHFQSVLVSMGVVAAVLLVVRVLSDRAARLLREDEGAGDGILSRYAKQRQREAAHGETQPGARKEIRKEHQLSLRQPALSAEVQISDGDAAFRALDFGWRPRAISCNLPGMKLLIFGGTRFVGRHLVEAALARGDQVTLFNRGQTDADLFPEVEKLKGDRDGGLDALKGRTWDAVVDTCGFVPRIVRASAELLRDAVAHYTFVSSCSVYADPTKPGVDESGPVGKLEDETVEEITAETYGPLKALCEQAVEQALPGHAFHVRAGLIVGPYDYTDRFSYWPRRIGQGGEVLAPGKPEAPVQFVDGRDLAEWILRMAEGRKAGVFNATGPNPPVTLGELLEACRLVAGSDARFTWVDSAFLVERKVAPYSELPLWVPEETQGFNAFNCRKAWAAGLSFRPLDETIRDTWKWDATRSPEQRMAGARAMIPGPLGGDRERDLLDEWLSHVPNGGQSASISSPGSGRDAT